MRLYTRSGDTGETSLIGGRVSKASIRIEAIGAVDEANSLLGMVIAHLTAAEEELKRELLQIQHELFDCGTDLSRKEPAHDPEEYRVQEEMVRFLEERIDTYQAETPELRRFILPGGTPAAACLHAARTVVRRAERMVVRLAEEDGINPVLLRYLNRLSDYLFAAARVLNHRAGEQDLYYMPESSAKVNNKLY